MVNVCNLDTISQNVLNPDLQDTQDIYDNRKKIVPFPMLLMQKHYANTC